MNVYRTQAQARKLALDFIAFKLELEKAKRSSDVISVLTEKSCACFRAVMAQRYNVARKLIDEVIAVSYEYKPRREKDAIQIVRLTNLAGEVVRGLKK